MSHYNSAVDTTATTFVKAGAGTLTLDNSAGGLHAADTTWQVSQGTLVATAPLPLGLGGSTQVTLAGGTFEVQGQATIVPGLRQSWLHSTDVAGNLDAIGTGNGNGGLIAATPEGFNVLTGPLNYPQGQFSPVMGGATEDNIKFLWSGQLNVTTAGTYLFGVGNVNGLVPAAQGLDDDVVYYLDLNGDHAFQDAAGEKLFRQGCCPGSASMSTGVSLTPGVYDIAIGFSNGGGGRYIGAVYSSDGGTNWQLIDPSAQPGVWTSTQYGAIDATLVHLTVTADSTLRATSDSTAAFGLATLNSGTTLTTVGADDVPAGRDPRGRGPHRHAVQQQQRRGQRVQRRRRRERTCHVRQERHRRDDAG